MLILTLIISSVLLSCNHKVKPDVTPEAYLEKMLNNPRIQGQYTGEGFCWQARVGMNQFLNNFEITDDLNWLDAGVKYFDYLISRMDTDPDGYRGWIGSFGRGEQVFFSDALVGDAILITEFLDFAILVLEDEDLRSKYAEKANSYMDLAKKDFVEKWDKRGSWYEDGPYASYVSGKRFVIRDSIKVWVESNRPRMSNPFNKLFDAAQVSLRLYRITGDKFYWNKAEKIFFTAKCHFQYFDDHYCWNYYEPLTPGDIDLGRNTTRHWVGVHPWRTGYQASEVDKIVEAYHYGMVFDEQDIRRIINTNLKVMWNGDRANPEYINSNGLGADKDTSGLASFRRTNGHSNRYKNEGQLWTGLLDFDQTVRDLYELRFRDGKNMEERLNYEKTIKRNPPSFARKYAKGDVNITPVSFTESRDIYCAVAIPHRFKAGEKTILCCKSMRSGELQIDLVSLSGEKIKNIYKGTIEGSKEIGWRGIILPWDGKDQDTGSAYVGEYRIRWTIGSGYREFPVKII